VQAEKTFTLYIIRPPFPEIDAFFNIFRYMSEPLKGYGGLADRRGPVQSNEDLRKINIPQSATGREVAAKKTHPMTFWNVVPFLFL